MTHRRASGGIVNDNFGSDWTNTKVDMSSTTTTTNDTETTAFSLPVSGPTRSSIRMFGVSTNPTNASTGSISYVGPWEDLPPSYSECCGPSSSSGPSGTSSSSRPSKPSESGTPESGTDVTTPSHSSGNYQGKRSVQTPCHQPKTSHTQNAIRYRDDKRWASDRRCLTVRFLNGSQEKRRLVKRIVIENYNSIPMVIRFVFLRPSDLGFAAIRVRFADGADSSSLEGTENKYSLFGDIPTMTLNLSGGAEFHQNTILQTFGLALGLRLEHLHPDSGISFNHTELRRQGITEQDIKMVWTVSGIDKRRTVPYDRKSIMHYPVEVEETTNLRQRIPHNNCLSKGDRAQLLEMYPAAPPTNGNTSASGSTGSSRRDNGDDDAKHPKKNSKDVTVIKYGRKTVEVPNTYVDRKGRERKISPFTRMMMKWVVT